MTAAECLGCGRNRMRIGEGLCADCFREKYGESLWLDDQRKRLRCTAEGGCNNFGVSSDGLCQKHAMRKRRHGHIEETRPPDWGQRRSHPLYEMWKTLCGRYKDHVCEAWRTDFWKFVSDVGDRPSERHVIYRLTTAKIFEPGNTKWRAPKLETEHATSTREGRNAYMRDWAKRDPMRWKSVYLQRHYGIDLAEYNRLYDSQNGNCAICHHPDHVMDKRTGKPRLLAVDHDHITNKVRGLLCTNCNKGIGHLQDDVSLLQSAIAYLEKHAATKETQT